jgi:hypothetical protein
MAMSALLPKADIAERDGMSALCQKQTFCAAAKNAVIRSPLQQLKLGCAAISGIFAGERDVSGRDEDRLPFRRSRIGARTLRYNIVPAGQMSKLRSYLYVCQPAADIDCD